MIIDTTVLSPWRPPFPVLNLMDIMIMTTRTFVGDDDDLVGLIMVWTFIHEWIEETPSRRALVINNVFTMKAMIILIIKTTSYRMSVAPWKCFKCFDWTD